MLYPGTYGNSVVAVYRGTVGVGAGSVGSAATAAVIVGREEDGSCRSAGLIGMGRPSHPVGTLCSSVLYLDNRWNRSCTFRHRQSVNSVSSVKSVPSFVACSSSRAKPCRISGSQHWSCLGDIRKSASMALPQAARPAM